jgi:hypothetical protein
VDLQKIDVWSLETGEGRIDGIEDCSTRQAGLVDILGLLIETWCEERANGGIITNETITLCGNDDLMARNVVL